MSATGRGASTGHERDSDDNYATPAWTTRAILRHLKHPRVLATVLDPCCGHGAILDVCKQQWAPATMYGLELDPGRSRSAQLAHAVRNADSLDEREREHWPDADLLITNPPYRLAMDFILVAFQWLIRQSDAGHPGEAAFLLRLNFLGSAKRAAFHLAHPADVYVLPSRPEFCMSVTCRTRERRSTGGEHVENVGCGWHVTLPADAERPKVCGGCGIVGLSITTTDATEYAWFVWGPGRGNRWHMLTTEGR